MPDFPPISAVLITRDAELKIAATLRSLSAFPEIVVYDNGSTDRTVEIARGFDTVTVHEGEFLGFGPTKNHAASLATNDWIFSIDSDETITPELSRSIATANLEDINTAYSIHRINFIRGKRIRFSGWRNDWIVRLYNRKVAGLTDASVHEKVVPASGGTVRKMEGELWHDAIRELGDFLIKINRYAELRRLDPPTIHSPAVIFLRSLWAFFRTYILQLGFLDGWRGLVIAVCAANGVFFKYMLPFADSVAEKESFSGHRGLDDETGRQSG